MSSEKIDNVEVIKNQLSKSIADVTEASKGDMNLYSASKNMRIQIINKQKIIKSDYTKFEENITRLQPSVAVLISFNDEIPFRIKSYILNDKPILEIHINHSDISDRFIDMLANQETISETESKTLSLENSKKKPKESFIESFKGNFDEYCKSCPISKIEYEKVKSKWTEEMKQFENRTKFIEFIRKSRESTTEHNEEKQTEGTEEQFNEYIKTTALSKITKKEIKAKFGNLSDNITYLNKTGDDFKSSIKKLKESLQK